MVPPPRAGKSSATAKSPAAALLAVLQLLAVVLLAVGLLAGCAPAARVFPAAAPGPSPAVVTPDLTVTRTDPRGVGQSIQVWPDGSWLFTPSAGSAWVGAINYGRLDPARHTRLAALLTVALAATAAPGPTGAAMDSCPGGYRYQLETVSATASWNGCDDQSALNAILALLSAAEPAF